MKEKIILGIVILVVCILTAVVSYFIFDKDHEYTEPPEHRTIEELYIDTVWNEPKPLKEVFGNINGAGSI